MTRNRIVVTLAVWLAVSASVRAQDPSSAASAAAAPPAPPAQAAGIVGLVQMAAGAIKACKAKICACPLGQLIQNAAKPANAMLGGLLCPPCCPPVNPNDLKQPSTSAVGACAKITQDELEMPKRRKAVQCLARADCHWWPEAEAGLITALRVDQNECIRLEAAMALLNGCCCTKKTIAALTIVVTGSKKDGNPSENSERVKAAALAALQRCLTCYTDEDEPTPPEAPPKKPPAKPPAKPVAGLDSKPECLVYYDEVDKMPSLGVLNEARRVLVRRTPSIAMPEREVLPASTAGRSFSQLWDTAEDPRGTAYRTAGPTVTVQANPRVAPLAQNQVVTPAVYQPESAPRVRLMFQE